MPNKISRKRLKKKLLDRWENEGGRLADDDTDATASKTTPLPGRCAPDQEDRSSDESRKPSRTN